MANYSKSGSNGGEEGIVSLGQSAWNIADGFTKIKILRLMIELDIHETIAYFGKKDVEEPVPTEQIPYRRMESFNRIIFCLRQLIGNTKFAIKNKKDKQIIELLLQRVENVENNISTLYEEKENHLTKERVLVINEPYFIKCFNILRNVKDELNIPANNSSLIFRQSEDFDIDSIMRDIAEGG